MHQFLGLLGNGKLVQCVRTAQIKYSHVLPPNPPPAQLTPLVLAQADELEAALYAMPSEGSHIPDKFREFGPFPLHLSS